ncbi:MAG: hypothetical protein J7K61_05415 [Thermoplasmata archaeon]|nr:hypothetical protein [Thermoplasmata archaeon]
MSLWIWLIILLIIVLFGWKIIKFTLKLLIALVLIILLIGALHYLFALI